MNQEALNLKVTDKFNKINKIFEAMVETLGKVAQQLERLQVKSVQQDSEIRSLYAKITELEDKIK